MVDWLVEKDTCKVNCPEVKIFFDTNVSPRCRDGPSSNNRPTDPTFIWNATVGMTLMSQSSYDILGNSPTFRTNFNLYPFFNYSQERLYVRHRSMTYYPFDAYRSTIFAFAQETSTNNSVNLALGLASPLINDIKLTTHIMREEPPYSDDMDVEQEVIGARITLRRSPLIIGYCLVITATFCSVFTLLLR
ncbi:uncharacterized protein ARMOST_20104 [Armillaria ostoyae]|uniref:Uncharacterized protein n=1 Tax=Armillaria ostoyae TaxID=47428 RepID=A0A284S6F4_ARMOS|nr:uncharacterized protein ARMOST_20104 [Armillaria ostoyae]